MQAAESWGLRLRLNLMNHKYDELESGTTCTKECLLAFLDALQFASNLAIQNKLPSSEFSRSKTDHLNPPQHEKFRLFTV